MPIKVKLGNDRIKPNNNLPGKKITSLISDVNPDILTFRLSPASLLLETAPRSAVVPGADPGLGVLHVLLQLHVGALGGVHGLLLLLRRDGDVLKKGFKPD